jgi:outer membrane protein OmpA-like peptidoglycan-associated protein/tetratricopeptide (TPR) repeat protein
MKHQPKYLLGAALFALCSFGATAQTSSDYLRAAERFFKEGDYFSASQYYEKYLTGAPGKDRSGFSPYVIQKATKTVSAPASTSGRKDVVYNLAESYRKINYFSKAEPYYKEAAEMGTVNPLAPYWHAKCERAMGNLDSAEAEFKTFQTAYTTQDDVSKDVQKELDNLAFVKAQRARKDLGRYEVNKGNNPMNASGASYAPFYMADGTLSFTSTRPEGSADSVMATAKSTGKNPYTNKVYTAATSSTISSDVQKLSVPADKSLEQGVAAFTPDGNKMFLTRWEMKSGKKVAALYSATKSSDGGWSSPSKLGSSINTDGASVQQPFVTADGKYLLFSSNKAGGQGGFDLWFVGLSETFEPAADVMNMGTSINTAGDDEAPFYHMPSKTLVYATNGKVGMGGYDLFYAKGDLAGATWEAPMNMGQPVNSVKDDIYYATNDAKNIWTGAMLSSDRDSPCCLELYSFNRKNLPKNITGTVVDCAGNKPLAGVAVNITDASGKVITTKTTDASGKYTLTLPEYQTLKVSGSNAGYNSNSINVTAPETEEDAFTNPALCLTAIPPKPYEEKKAILLGNVLYAFGKATLQKSSFPALDSLSMLMKEYPAMEVELSAHTDNVGSDKANDVLSQKRAQSCVAYLIKKGIEKTRLKAVGYGESQPIAENEVDGKDNPEGRAQNRRTEFKILHY